MADFSFEAPRDSRGNWVVGSVNFSSTSGLPLLSRLCLFAQLRPFSRNELRSALQNAAMRKLSVSKADKSLGRACLTEALVAPVYVQRPRTGGALVDIRRLLGIESVPFA